MHEQLHVCGMGCGAPPSLMDEQAIKCTESEFEMHVLLDIVDPTQSEN